jgi:hypothetical protein
MNKSITTPDSLQPATELAVDLFDNWFDPIETEVRARSGSSSKNYFGANSMLRCHGRATDAARWPAMKQKLVSRAIATAAGREG